MRYFIAALSTGVFAFALAACAHHAKYTSEKALAAMPAKMETLKPGMTTDEILHALNATNFDGGVGGGWDRRYCRSYILRPGCSLLIITDEQRYLPLEVDLHTPSQNTTKIFQN